MKIEKLTENKIRVVVNLEDLEKNNIDIQSFFTKSIDSQGLFFNILEQAEKELDFHTEGCKLLIEAFSSLDDILVFTITKYLPVEKNDSQNSLKRKKIIAKRKSFNTQKNQAIYSFDNFETFCNFCSALNNAKNLDIKKISKFSSLYLYNNIYYLFLKDINNEYININSFYCLISEFAKMSSFSNNFSDKLLEHGKIIIKKDAINIGIQYFGVSN